MSKPRKGKTVTQENTQEAQAAQADAQQTSEATQAPQEDQTAAAAEANATADTGAGSDADATQASTEGNAPENTNTQTSETATQEPAPADQAAGEGLLLPKTELEMLVEQAQANGDNVMKSVVQVCTEYRDQMHPQKAAEKATIRTQQLAFFRLFRDILRSPNYYAQALNTLLQFMREDYDGAGALSVPFMMRGFDDDTLENMTEDNRKLFWAVVTLLTTAAGLNDPKQTYKKVNMQSFQASGALTPEMKQRLVSFFSA